MNAALTSSARFLRPQNGRQIHALCKQLATTGRLSTETPAPRVLHTRCGDKKIKMGADEQTKTTLSGHRSSSCRSYSLETRVQEDTSTNRTDGLVITAASLDVTSRNVDVTCSDGKTYSYPYVWLRDNCQCPECFNQHTLSRAFLMKDLDVDVTATQVTVDDQSNTLRITWDSGHVSTFPSDWLWKRSFTAAAQSIRDTWYSVKPKHWDAKLQLPTVSYMDVLEDDRALYDFLQHLAETGLVLVRGTPCETKSIYDFSQRIAFLRKTNYGETWKVRGTPGTTNIAYTTLKLGMHNDLPYYRYQPGVQLMLCVQQCGTEGGANFFSDGCHLTQRLRDETPEFYDLLTTTPIDYTYEEDDYYKFLKILQVPLLSVDKNGRLERVSYNQHKRDSFFNIPLDKVQPYYRALKHFDNLLADQSNVFWTKLQDGDMICFDNLRILHGRSAYTLSGDDVRHYEGGYIDWDEVYSRLRVLRKKLNIDC